MSAESEKMDMYESRLVITRTFDAPLPLVWKAWSDPTRLAQWWGPKGFTAPIIKLDFRVGGKYLFCMRSSEGQDFWTTGIYKEIIPMSKIVCTDSFADEKGNIVSATHYGMKEEIPEVLLINIEFREENGKTIMTLTHLGMPAGEMGEMATAGWNEFFDKLSDTLQTIN